MMKTEGTNLRRVMGTVYQKILWKEGRGTNELKYNLKSNKKKAFKYFFRKLAFYDCFLEVSWKMHALHALTFSTINSALLTK